MARPRADDPGGAASSAAIAALGGTTVIVPAAGSTSTSVALQGVATGQAIALFWFSTALVLPTSITDTFSTGYTWTLVQSITGNDFIGALYIGTGGSGTSGTVTVTTSALETSGAMAVPTVNVSGVDVSGSNSGTSATPTFSLTPSAAGECAIYACIIDSGSPTINPLPAYPWINASANYADLAMYISPPASVSLVCNWGILSGHWITLGMILK